MAATMGKFTGRTVVVTGAGSGIGLAITRQFLAEGADVIAADVNLDGIPSAALPIRADVAVLEDVRSLMDEAARLTGRIDVVCSNAGVGSVADVHDCTLDEWESVFAVNARGTFLCAKFALTHMLAAGSGVIINTASVAGLIGLRDRA